MKTANGGIRSTMSSSTHSLEQIAQLPNVLGAVRVDDSGSIIDHTGPEAEALGNVLSCMQQLAGLVGASFGLEYLEEIRLSGKSLEILAIPEDADCLGVVLGPRARVNEISNRLRSSAA